MRLIDADAIPWDVEGVGEIPVITKEEIDQMPTVDAVPVKHGKYIGSESFFYEWECSECGCVFESKPVYKYCPTCGARMDEDDETD